MKTVLPVFLLGSVLGVFALTQPAVSASAATQSVSVVRPADWATPIDPARNLYQIAPGLYRSAQPEQRDAARLKQLDIHTVINFRANHRDEDVLDLPGVRLIHIPMDTWNIGDDQIVSALRAIAQARKDGPVLIHCKHGADRTGVVSALYRIIEQGWTPEQASRELKEGGYGYHSLWVNIPRYIKRANIEALRTRLTLESVR
jgi:protein tyrosine/serine phosphatase